MENLLNSIKRLPLPRNGDDDLDNDHHMDDPQEANGNDAPGGTQGVNVAGQGAGNHKHTGFPGCSKRYTSSGRTQRTSQFFSRVFRSHIEGPDERIGRLKEYSAGHGGFETEFEVNHGMRLIPYFFQHASMFPNDFNYKCLGYKLKKMWIQYP